ncbi:MAG: hypothetical protein H8K10_07235 [Nitrospira sp.]|nr:hypothetical protein [Nitrospira sp.]
MRTSRRRRMVTAGLLGATVFCIAMVSGLVFVGAQGHGEEKRNHPQSAIETAKEKGFDGVDFSYDLFGAPPGQSTTQIAEEVMAKDRAEKPKVMARQAELFA